MLRIIVCQKQFSPDLVVSFDPVVYMVREDAGSLELTATVQGVSVISLSVVIATSHTNATADGDAAYITTSILK